MTGFFSLDALSDLRVAAKEGDASSDMLLSVMLLRPCEDVSCACA